MYLYDFIEMYVPDNQELKIIRPTDFDPIFEGTAEEFIHNGYKSVSFAEYKKLQKLYDTDVGSIEIVGKVLVIYI